MKYKYGLDQESKAENIFPAVINGISVLRDEINKQYAYWETHDENNKGHEPINHIILCGGEANLAGLSDYLELSMKMKVENANVWVNVLKTEDKIPEMSFEESLSYATVIGLSLGSYMYKSQPVINVLPYEDKKILRKEYWMRFFTIIFNLIALTGVTASFLLFPSYFISQSKENLVENRLEVFNSENPNLNNDNINKITEDINSRLEILSKAEPAYQTNDKVLNNIFSSRTNGITFSQILFNKKTTEGNASVLEIYGTAANRDSLRNFKTTLDNNPNFSKVDLPISNFLEKTELNFTISITMK
jgi:cell division ATPase FtsA